MGRAIERGPVAAPLVQIGASDKGMWVLTLSHCPIPDLFN